MKIAIFTVAAAIVAFAPDVSAQPGAGPDIFDAKIGAAPADGKRSSAADGKNLKFAQQRRKTRTIKRMDHRGRIKRRDHRRQKVNAPAGQRWVRLRDGTFVAVPERGTALIRQGYGYVCLCRESRKDHCTDGMSDDGKEAFCGDKSQGSCGGDDACKFVTKPTSGDLRLPQAPRVAQ